MNLKKTALVSLSVLAVALIGGRIAFADKAKHFPGCDSVVLINVFEVPPGKVAETIQSWEKSRDFLAEQPGYLHTRLHQNRDSNGRFQLVNIARWRSAADFEAATAKMRETLPNALPEGTVATPALYDVVRSDGKMPPFLKGKCEKQR
jgi:antibiotic biosynthesis monooxygenase